MQARVYYYIKWNESALVRHANEFLPERHLIEFS